MNPDCIVGCPTVDFLLNIRSIFVIELKSVLQNALAPICLQKLRRPWRLPMSFFAGSTMFLLKNVSVTLLDFISLQINIEEVIILRFPVLLAGNVEKFSKKSLDSFSLNLDNIEKIQISQRLPR